MSTADSSSSRNSGPRRSDRKRSAPDLYSDESSTTKRARKSGTRKSSASASSTSKKRGGTAKGSAGKGKAASSGKGRSAGRGAKGTQRRTNLKAPKGGSKEHPMNDDQAQEGVEDDRKAGKAATTQSGRYVHEEMERMKRPQKGVHKPVSRQQAIAIGLSKARKAGVRVPPNPNRS